MAGAEPVDPDPVWLFVDAPVPDLVPDAALITPTAFPTAAADAVAGASFSRIRNHHTGTTMTTTTTATTMSAMTTFIFVDMGAFRDGGGPDDDTGTTAAGGCGPGAGVDMILFFLY